MDEPILVLNGEGSGPVNNLCVPSNVASGYAPAGASLVSVSVVEGVESAVTLAGAETGGEAALVSSVLE